MEITTGNIPDTVVILRDQAVDFSRSKHVEWPNMTLQGTIISPKASHKFLGVMLDQDLRWHQQADYAIGKASKWIMAY